jgi:hypothetical protein
VADRFGSRAPRQLRVDWVLPGHGTWHRVGVDRYAEQMAALAERMTRVDRRRWYADKG